ncbi:MAG TPA: ATP-grasp domain-containing protein [Terracidiphilus sp.]
MNGIRILLTDTKRWAVGVRIGMVFAEMGCEVGMLCAVEGHPAHTVCAIRHRFAYDGFKPITSLRSAMEQFRPDLVIPTCDRGVAHLHKLHAEERAHGNASIADCIEHSLGPAKSFAIVSNRHEFLKLAAAEGVRIPATMPLRDEAGLLRAEMLGLPLVIKADGTWGGSGVRIARSTAEARDAFEALRSTRGVLRLLKELALNRDRGNTLHDWRSARPALIAQAYVEGRPANCAVACRDGNVLAAIAVEVTATNGSQGPASVVEVVEGREMVAAAERIVRRLRLSGFFGFDFMVEQTTGAAYLIEMNARSTPPCSLKLGRGKNLPAAMWASLAGTPEPQTETVTALSRIAYFPRFAANLADLNLPLWSYYYDVPEGEPDFVDLLLNQWPDRSLLGQWLDARRGIDRGTAVRARFMARRASRRTVESGEKQLQTGTD